ncbi:MAG TPA: DUF72 domain-containing protein [Candidatus Limnocylindria bacterium]|nr:DUF72 domain-containing protein [Candidatus Limnocylindria bacterium]
MAAPIRMRRPRVLVGTSGFSYPAWRPAFYPPDVPAAGMLKYYAGVFDTVEINHSFYRMPTPALLTGWRRQVGPQFRFALKAPQRITHQRRLRDCEELARDFVRLAGTLGPSLGPLLFQLPPHLKADVPRLAEFARALPTNVEAAFEFRHPSWFDDETYAVLRERRLALCIADTDEATTPLVATAPFGYVRLRRMDYTPAALAEWAARLRGVDGWKRVYVYVKHDEAGRAPALARALLAAIS